MDSRLSIKRHLKEIPFPLEVQEVMASIRALGGDVYVVGGALRDWCWRPAPFNGAAIDWDLTTNLSPSVLRQLSQRYHPGEAFGTYRLGSHIEATIMRREGRYSDSRHPDKIIPAESLRVDLSRRDFRVNALAFDGQRLEGVKGALSDLRDRVMRAVGDPLRRFQEDPLRMVRFVRFLGVLGAKADPATWEAMHDNRSLIQKVSRERRLGEFVKFLQSPFERWSLWSKAGMNLALDWPLPQKPFVAFIKSPSHPAGQIAAYRLFSCGSLEGLSSWLGQWPLPSSWRQGLTALLTTSYQFDPDLWAQKARSPQAPYGWIFRDLALAAGVAENDLDPIAVALSPHDLQNDWGLHGPRLGAAWRYLAHLAAQHPEINSRALLTPYLNAWLNQQP